MLAQRVAQQSLRRVVAQHQAFNLASLFAVATGNVATRTQRRGATATTISGKDAEASILAQQRLNRPVSPHLSIYQPQLTWIPSIMNRITGLILSGGFYAFGTAYLIAPYAGLHMDSASIAAAVGAWPFAVKFVLKSLIGFTFSYHSINGVRHLIWDTASMISNKKVVQSSVAVLALSVVSALGLALW